jgi:hypothetical protein
MKRNSLLLSVQKHVKLTRPPQTTVYDDVLAEVYQKKLGKAWYQKDYALLFIRMKEMHAYGIPFNEKSCLTLLEAYISLNRWTSVKNMTDWMKERQMTIQPHILTWLEQHQPQ